LSSHCPHSPPILITLTAFSQKHKWLILHNSLPPTSPKCPEEDFSFEAGGTALSIGTFCLRYAVSTTHHALVTWSCPLGTSRTTTLGCLGTLLCLLQTLLLCHPFELWESLRAWIACSVHLWSMVVSHPSLVAPAQKISPWHCGMRTVFWLHAHLLGLSISVWRTTYI